MSTPSMPRSGAGRSVDRYSAFAAELEDLRRETIAKVGAVDVAHMAGVDGFSRVMEVVGRLLIHFSPGPVTFLLGVAALFVHKELQAAEIGHTVLHGTFDRVPGGERFRSARFYWDIPAGEALWRRGHNSRHHGHTNVVGSDADVQFGPVRFNDHVEWSPQHRWQRLVAVGLLIPLFGFLTNFHLAGLSDHYFRDGRAWKPDVLEEDTPAQVRRAWRTAAEKYLPYYALNYLAYPLLAGPLFWKVALGNLLAELLRNIYFGLTVLSGHVGGEVLMFPEGSRACSKGEWYAMQVEAAHNFEVSRPLSLLCGALDYQIEHHLFPTLPPNRLREIAPRVREICQRHGVKYESASWPQTLRKIWVQLGALERPTGFRAPGG